MAYQSGEFLINKTLGNYSNYQSAVTIFDGHVVLMTAWGQRPNSTYLTETKFPLARLLRSTDTTNMVEQIDDDALKKTDNWTSARLQFNATVNKPALVAVPVQSPDTLFIFYYQTLVGFTPAIYPSVIYASYRSSANEQDATNDGEWNGPIELYDSNGITGPKPSSVACDINTTTIGDDLIVVACSSASPQNVVESKGREFQPGKGTFVGLYDKNKADFKNKKWVAEYSVYVPCPPNVVQGGIMRVLVEWHSEIGTLKNENGELMLDQYLTLITMSNDPGLPNAPYLNVYAYSSPIKFTEDKDKRKGNVVTLAVFQPLAQGNINTVSFAGDKYPPIPFLLADLTRDAAGRLRCWFSHGGNKQFIAYNLEIQVAEGKLVFTATTDEIVASEANERVAPSSSLTYIAAAGVYPSQMKPPNPSLNGTSPDHVNVNNYPVYEFVFYGQQLRCQVKRVGTIQAFADPNDHPRNLMQKDPNNPIYIIGGIFNGPLPFPIKNYGNIDPGDIELNAGTLTYGTKTTETAVREVDKTIAIGLEAEGKTTKGVGPAFKLSFKSGIGSVQENTVEKEFIIKVPQEAKMYYDKAQKLLKPIDKGIIKIRSASAKVAAYNYNDNYGASVDATKKGNKMAFGTIEIGFSESSGGSIIDFVPFNVTPGDLNSYRPEEINKTMIKLGYKGSDYQFGEDNYFGDIVCRNALPIGKDSDYLEMTWTENGATIPKFSEKTTSFRETNWTYDRDIYAGASGGGGFELFGDGEEFEFSLMGGIDMSQDNKFSTESKIEWGIDVIEPWGPKVSESDEDGAVSKYVVRIYFLPVPSEEGLKQLPPTHWTDELLKYLPPDSTTRNKIDKNSACWQIFYAVTTIEYKNGKNNYYYDTAPILDRTSVYAT